MTFKSTELALYANFIIAEKHRDDSLIILDNVNDDPRVRVIGTGIDCQQTKVGDVLLIQGVDIKVMKCADKDVILFRETDIIAKIENDRTV